MPTHLRSSIFLGGNLWKRQGLQLGLVQLFRGYRSSMEAPRWALRLMRRMAADYKIVPPLLYWKTRRSLTSSGYCTLRGDAIGVGEGSDKQDARLALLHEMCHNILLKWSSHYRGEHGAIFYDFFWPIIRRYRFPMKVALAFEGRHHKYTVALTYRRGGGSLKC